MNLLVRTREQEQIIIEVQATMEWDYLSRLLYGTSKAITEYIQRANLTAIFARSFSVSILFFNLEGKAAIIFIMALLNSVVFITMISYNWVKMNKKHMDQIKRPLIFFPNITSLKSINLMNRLVVTLMSGSIF